jgi:hypothetical protein
VSLQAIHGFVRGVFSGSRKTQVANLARITWAVLEQRSLCLCALARALPGPRRLVHRVKRVWRFTSNMGVEPGRLWAGLCGMAPGLRPEGALPIVLDETRVSRRFKVLWAAVVWRRRALPLAALPYPTGCAGSQRMRWREAFTAQVAQALGTGARRAVFLADRGFGGLGWLRLFARLRLDFVVRVSGRMTLCYRGRRLRAADLPATPGQTVAWHGVLLGRRDPVVVNIVVAWALGAAEPWVLATSVREADAAVRLYAQRMRIEQMFRDMKSHLGLRRLQVTTSGRAARLLMALAAACWALALLARSIPRLWQSRIAAVGRLSYLTSSLEWLRRQRWGLRWKPPDSGTRARCGSG